MLWIFGINRRNGKSKKIGNIKPRFSFHLTFKLFDISFPPSNSDRIEILKIKASFPLPSQSKWDSIWISSQSFLFCAPTAFSRDWVARFQNQISFSLTFRLQNELKINSVKLLYIWLLKEMEFVMKTFFFFDK